MDNIQYTVCNTDDLVELIWIDEPKAVSIFIDFGGLITVSIDNSKKLTLREFERGTTLFDVQLWIENYMKE